MLKQTIIFLVCSIYAIGAVTPTTYVYKTIGNFGIEADVYVPTVTHYAKYPVFFTLHGGGYVVGGRFDAFTTEELNEALSRGWLVVSIDYRLSPNATLDDIVVDVQDAYNWIRTELVNEVNLDPDCIAVFGGSAGGGLAVLSGYKLTPRPKVVVAFYPYCTNFTGPYAYNSSTPVEPSFVSLAESLNVLISNYSTTDPNDPRNLLFDYSLQQQKAGWVLTTLDPNEPSDQILAALTDLSAVYNVDKDYPPTYLAHGLNDTLVPYEQSVQMAAQLKSNGIPYKLDLVPNANHGFDFTNNILIWIEHVLPAFNFAQQYLEPEQEKIIS